MNKFKVGDTVRIINTGSAVSNFNIEGKRYYGSNNGDICKILGFVTHTGSANSDDPRYYGNNFNLRAEGLQLVKSKQIITEIYY